MLTKAESGKKLGGDSSNQKLRSEIEAISKALYLDNNPSRSSVPAPSYIPSKSIGRTHNKHGREDPSQKEKKSIWNWPLRAFSHVRNRRFNCCFSLQVHSIEGLPSSFDGLSLSVHWRRRDECLTTRPSKFLNGTAEFEEKLTYTCSVYGSRRGPHHSAKYEAKHFLLYASVLGAHDIDLGKHRIDLTRLLPLTLEELQDEKSSGKWSTTFQLIGNAKGATLNVSFGYKVIGDNNNSAPSGNFQNVRGVLNAKQDNVLRTFSTKSRHGDGKGTIQQTESLPSVVNQGSHSVEEIKDLHEVLPMSQSDLASSVNVLFRKFDEDKMDPLVESNSELDIVTKHIEPVEWISDSVAENDENACEGTELSALGHKMEVSLDDQVKSEEIMKDGDFSGDGSVEVVEVAMGTQLPPKEGIKHYSEEETDIPRDYHNPEQDDRISKEQLMKELESALKNAAKLETAVLDSSEDQENYAEAETRYDKPNQEVVSPNSKDVTESVASELLNMLGIEHGPFGLSSESEPESPRERLLREFQMETLASGSSLFDFGINDEVHQAEYDCNPPEEFDEADFHEDFDLASIIHDMEEEYQMEIQAEMSRRARAKKLEDLETEALMREWGLNERDFQNSPPQKGSSTTFGPADLLPEEPLELPPLGEGLGPFLQTKNGGFLRSMNPSLFRNSITGGSLIMQVSTPVVVPAEMGSGVMEILQRLVSVGIEKLSMQANKLMPLDDVTGKTMQQVAWESSPAMEEYLLQHESDIGQDTSVWKKRAKGKSSSGGRSNYKFNPTSGNNDMGSECVSLEDLAPLAMDKIEALSLEGLRIQSGMSDEDEPSNITAKSIGEISAFQGKSGSLGLEGAAGLQLLDVKDNGDDVDGLMGLSLSLDEWMKLDSGDIGNEDEISEHTSKILAAHHANSLELIRRGPKGEKRKGRSGRKCGLLGNNFTVALMVQLRDPLRNYEPVGAPMLSLIQVERVFVPPKPKIYSTVPVQRKNSEEDDDESEESVVKDKTKEEKAVEEQGVAQYKITEVHLTGLKTEPGKKKLWGSTTQQQSGSRWLLANGMGKGSKHPLMKSKSVSTKNSKSSGAPSTTKVEPGDTLWSISARVHGSGSKWKELAALNPHIRNPNIIMPNETIRLL